jgi:hypothetical protein
LTGAGILGQGMAPGAPKPGCTGRTCCWVCWRLWAAGAVMAWVKIGWCWAGAVVVLGSGGWLVVVCCWGAVSELATDGSSPKPGLLRLRSACMAVAAACLVTISACVDGACWGDPGISWPYTCDFFAWSYEFVHVFILIKPSQLMGYGWKIEKLCGHDYEIFLDVERGC